MELTQGELEKINALLPSRYRLEIKQNSDSVITRLKDKRPEGRKVPQEPSFSVQAPEKRPTRERKTVAYDEIDSGFRSSEGYKKLFRILQTLKKHPMSETFLNPVSQTEYPDYYRKIEHPMDLNKVESKLRGGIYESGYDFAMDVRLVWVNSFLYNHKNSELFSQTVELCAYFESLIKGCEFFTLIDKKNQVVDLYKKIDKLSKGFKDMQNKGSSRPQVKAEKPMSLLEKKSLCQSIKNLEAKHLKGVLEIVKECMDIKGEELEFDIDKLPPRVCRELDLYVKNCLAGKKKAPEVKVAEASSSKLKELDSQLEQLVMMTREPQSTVEPHASPSESSSSDSEVSEMDSIAKEWGHYQSIEEASDHSNGFGSMMDFDKIY
jgi:hypothetical protein